MTPRLQQFVIISATVWSMTMLTLGYLGFAKPDSAFVASVLGGAISAAGLSVGDKKDPKQDPPNKDKDAGNY
jgi:membrane protein DedA with SNARE-associated domain